MIAAFQHLTTTKVVFAPDGLDRLGDELDALGGRRALLVCGTTVGKSAALEMVRAALGRRVVAVFDRVVPHSSPDIVDAGIAALRAARADVVVSLGGGSAIDTAKAMILLHAESGTLEEHRVRFTPPDRIEYRSYTSAMLPHAMEFNRPVAEAPLARAARALGREPSATAAIAAVRDLARAVGAPTRLRDLGVPRDGLAAMAEEAMRDRDVYYNPRRVESATELHELYEAAW